MEDGTSDDATMFLLAWLLQAAIVLEDKRAARALSERLACVAHLAIGEGFYTCPARHLGDAATLVGDLTAARAYYAQALEAAGKIRFRPELALNHLRLAELLALGGDHSAAQQHLDVALPELRDMKMRPALTRAMALSDHQHPPVNSALRSTAVLTAREREIASLMAGGLSNRDIAEQLVVTEGTVEVHAKHILSKLGFRSRTQVAGWFALQHSKDAADDDT
jgi:ATP/maltotriose-dependent transcriptional regulator MalT